MLLFILDFYQMEELQREFDKEKQAENAKTNQMESELAEVKYNLDKSLLQINEMGNTIRALEEQLRRDNESNLKMSHMYDNLVKVACQTSLALIEKTNNDLQSEDVTRCRVSPGS